MKVTVASTSCVTPLGNTPEGVWQAICDGKKADPAQVLNGETHRAYIGATVPAALTSCVARESRLRRSSPISLLAATAAKSAMEASGRMWTPAETSRLAIVFAVSSGGVQYTRRFYEQVVKTGANTASPMLFPETVYNAPASHVAAMLQVDGATYTLVGDGTIGLQALAFGAQLLGLGDADHVLVVAAEELDWILLEAHRDWRLTTDGVNPGALLAEGAAAVLLSREPGELSAEAREGHSFVTRAEAGAAIDAAVAQFAKRGLVDVIVSGSNDTWADALVDRAIALHLPNTRAKIVAPKRHVGEALGAGGLLQVVLAAAALRAGGGARALVASVGWNQQAAAALVERAE